MQLNALVAAMLGLSFLAPASPALSQAIDAGAIRLAQATEKDDDDKGKSRRPDRGDAKAKQEPKDAPKSAPKTTQDAAPKAPPSRETKQEPKQEPKSDAAQRDRTGGADKAKQDAEKAARDAKSRSDDDAKSRTSRERAKEPETKQQTQDRAKQPDTKHQTQEPAKQPDTKQQTQDRAKQPDTKQQTQDRAKQPDTKQQTQDRRDDDRRDSSRDRSKDDDRKDARERDRDDDRRDARDRGRDDDRKDARDRGRDDDRRDRGADRERSREWSREREQRRTSREELSRTEIRGDRTITIDGGSRTIRRDGDRVVIRGHDFDRLRHGRDGRGDSRVERLPNGYTRTVVFYPDGTQIVTVTGTRGEIVQRFRRDRGGREIYFIREMRRPPVAQINLGPLRLTIPREQYIVDNRRASPQELRAALIAPPVEAVERVYSLEEVRQFDRIRDKMRRIDIQTITFETDSAIIDPSQAQALEELANVILDLIERNPSEVFLIEGHTDLVGDDVYNLALSDRRAEAIAVALTDYFNVPPENLVTQGYGEQYPKIPTEIAERENRRVAVRRITPLVAEK